MFVVTIVARMAFGFKTCGGGELGHEGAWALGNASRKLSRTNPNPSTPVPSTPKKDAPSYRVHPFIVVRITCSSSQAFLKRVVAQNCTSAGPGRKDP